MARKQQEYTCTVTLTDGWQQRLTDAFVDLYYKRKEQGKEMLIKGNGKKSGASA